MTGMDFQTAFGEVVREQRLAQEKPMRSLSEKSYVALGFVSEVERGVKMPSSDTIEALSNGLGVPAYELIIEAGYRMAESAHKVPETPEPLFKIRDSEWLSQYADLKG